MPPLSLIPRRWPRDRHVQRQPTAPIASLVLLRLTRPTFVRKKVATDITASASAASTSTRTSRRNAQFTCSGGHSSGTTSSLTTAPTPMPSWPRFCPCSATRITSSTASLRSSGVLTRLRSATSHGTLPATVTSTGRRFLPGWSGPCLRPTTALITLSSRGSWP